MRHLQISFAAAVALLLHQPFAASAVQAEDTVDRVVIEDELIGYWAGAHMRGDGMLRVNYRFARDEDGALAAYKFYPDWIFYPEFGPNPVEIDEEGRVVLPQARGGEAVLTFDRLYNQLVGPNGAAIPAQTLYLSRAARPPEPPVIEREIRLGENNDIAAYVFLPQGDGPFAGVVLNQGRGCFRSARPQQVAGLLARYGVAAIAYDKPGTGDSAGDCSDNRFEDYVRIGVAARDHLAGLDRVDPERIGLFGSSLGAWTAPAVGEALIETGRPAPAFIMTWVGPATSIAQQQRDAAASIGAELGLGADELALVYRSVEIALDRGMDDRAAYRELMEIRAAAEAGGWLDAMFAPDDFPADAQSVDGLFLRRFQYDPAQAHDTLAGTPWLAIMGEDDPVVPFEVNADALREGLGDNDAETLRIVGLPGVGHAQERGDVWRTLGDGTAYFKFDRVEAEFLDEMVVFLREEGFAPR
ncbi:MAG: alpha/beta fold hydrolase [Oceanicaulis sp.]